MEYLDTYPGFACWRLSENAVFAENSMRKRKPRNGRDDLRDQFTSSDLLAKRRFCKYAMVGLGCIRKQGTEGQEF